MLKKTITYTDFDDTERTEDFYFNLTKAELMEIELTYGGFQNYIDQILAKKDNKALIDLFKKIIRMSYGEKSADGKKFLKNDEIADNFMSSAAYSTLFLSFFQDDNAAKDFIAAIIPKDLAEAAAKQAQE